ncbi:cytochrome oxidase putative small subunit CydP [Dokdonella ginsengisoli]|uniref:Cytochrome oxidase putative small subunit CydP n=1 Tax=Dokdonella ginsengisoli TaxID=363846 RepID=A0ABV9QZR6_9GAMM
MSTSSRSSDPSWFRGRGGRRFGLEFAAIIVLKLLALTLLWFFCIRPVPRADTAPAAVEDHLLTAPAEATHDR